LPVLQTSAGTARIATGTYSGDGNANQAITTGFKVKHIFVSVATPAARMWGDANDTGGNMAQDGGAFFIATNYFIITGSNGFTVTNEAIDTGSFNDAGLTYFYTAWG